MPNYKDKKGESAAAPTKRGGADYIAITGSPGAAGGTPETSSPANVDQNNGNENGPMVNEDVVGGPGGFNANDSIATEHFDHSQIDQNIYDESVSVEAYSRSQMLRHFHGATGGLGGIPTEFEEIVRDKEAPTKMVKQMFVTFSGMDDGALLDELKSRSQFGSVVIGKVNSAAVSIAIPLGMICNILKTRHGSNGNWIDYSEDNIIAPLGMSRRTMEKYMKLALMPGAGEYAEFGLDFLADAASAYSRLPYADKQAMGESPFLYYLNELDAEADSQKRRARMEAAVEVMKLQRMKVVVEVELVEEMHAVGCILTQKNRKFLKDLAESHGEKAPAQFIEKVIEEKGRWNDVVALPSETGKVTFEVVPSEARAMKQNTAPKVNSKIPSLIEQTVTLRESIRVMLESDYVADIEVSELDELLNAVKELKDRLETSTQTPAQATESAD